MASTHAEAQPGRTVAPASAGSSRAGLTITVRTGSGAGQTPLSAFDTALLDAGVGDFNLVTLSSVIPPASTIRHVDAPLAGTHGDLLFCVRAEAYADQPGQEAWAGLGWLTDDTGAGLFVEHHGSSEASVVAQIEQSLETMNRSRAGRFSRLQMTLSSAVCEDAPVCALVVAAYRVNSWFDDAPEPPRAPSGEPVTVEPAPVEPVLNGSPVAASGPAGTHGHVAEELTAAPASRNGSAPRAATGGAQPEGAHTTGWPAVVARVSCEKEIDYATAKRFYKLYAATFGILDTEAAGRQLLSEQEFLEEMLDPRVLKYVSWDHDDLAVAMTTVATDPDTLPWVSPTYFAQHYPEAYARGHVYYIGFTLVRPQHRGNGLFQMMLREALTRAMETGGVGAWDTCQANEERGMNATAMKVIEEVTGSSAVPIDRQTYYAVVLPDPPGGLRQSATSDG